MDFLELVTGARTCRRFREAEGMSAGMLDWLIAVSYTHLTLPTNREV